MTWEEYYDKFYDWAVSTQVRNLSRLTTLGDADEVAEIVFELQVDVPAANRLLRKAIKAGMAFKCDDLIEFLNICDEGLATEAVRMSAGRLSESDMEELYGFASEDVIKEVCKLRHYMLPEDMREEVFDEDEEFDEDESNEPDEPDEQGEDVIEDDDISEEYDAPRPKRHGGLFATLIAGIAGVAAGIDDVQNRHNGRCNGDCAHCPPHYGYRYGRWYYGHDHTHGCEFGGNKGSGGL